jgi:putative SOS response-associated peptidase YedK
MCGRYSLFTPVEDLEQRFDAVAVEGVEPTYNAAPGQQLPVVAGDRPDRIDRMRWGFVPAWAEAFDGGNINARAETVAEKPSFREAYERRRCLVPADGFYEWVEEGDGKRPYRVHFEDDRPFAMAGIWETHERTVEQTGLDQWTDGEASATTERVDTFAVLTTEPNDVVDPLHHRMAVILSPDEEAAWLAGESVSLAPHDGAEMDAYPVSTAVNDPANDRPELVEPA